MADKTTPVLTEQELLAVQVGSLRQQATLNRMNVSDAINSIMEYISNEQDTDHFVNPEFPKDKKSNPWVDTKKCTIV